MGCLVVGEKVGLREGLRVTGCLEGKGVGFSVTGALVLGNGVGCFEGCAVSREVASYLCDDDDDDDEEEEEEEEVH